MIPKWYHRLLVGGESGPDVDILHRKLGIVDTTYGEPARRYVRGMQQLHGMEATGVVCPDTAILLGEAADAHLTPEWFERPLSLSMQGQDVVELRRRLLSANDDVDVFDEELRRAVLRFQSANGLPLTGVADATLALHFP